MLRKGILHDFFPYYSAPVGVKSVVMSMSVCAHILFWLDVIGNWPGFVSYLWVIWCHCHPIISCFSKIQNGLPFWCQLTQVVLEKRPLNVCMYVCVMGYLSYQVILVFILDCWAPYSLRSVRIHVGFILLVYWQVSPHKGALHPLYQLCNGYTILL